MIKLSNPKIGNRLNLKTNRIINLYICIDSKVISSNRKRIKPKIKIFT
jgi:hypothetical protein